MANNQIYEYSTVAAEQFIADVRKCIPATNSNGSYRTKLDESLADLIDMEKASFQCMEATRNSKHQFKEEQTEHEEKLLRLKHQREKLDSEKRTLEQKLRNVIAEKKHIADQQERAVAEWSTQCAMARRDNRSLPAKPDFSGEFNQNSAEANHIQARINEISSEIREIEKSERTEKELRDNARDLFEQFDAAEKEAQELHAAYADKRREAEAAVVQINTTCNKLEQELHELIRKASYTMSVAEKISSRRIIANYTIREEYVRKL